MRVDDVEGPVVAAATRTPFEATRRVFVLERVDTMNDEVANRLLKTLEEPPSFVHLILLTDSLGQVLETVVSRCQLVRFDPLPAASVAAALEARGRAGRARAGLRAAGARQRRSRALAGLVRGRGAAARGRGVRRARPSTPGARPGPGSRCWRAPSSAASRPRRPLRPSASGGSSWSRRDASAARSSASSRRRPSATAGGRAPRRSTSALTLAGLTFRDLVCVGRGRDRGACSPPIARATLAELADGPIRAGCARRPSAARTRAGRWS